MTLQTNEPWQTKNDASVKRPIYAVSIDGGTTYYSDYEITDVTGTVFKYLVAINGISQTFDPIRSEASIGGVNFELLIDANIWNFDELYLTRVIVKAGYGGLAWSNFVEITSNIYIQSVSLNKTQTGFVFKCKDLQWQTNKNILEDIADDTVSGTADSATVNTLTDSILTQADDFWNGFYVVISQYTGKYQVREITDFDQGTNTITVSPNFDTVPDATSEYHIAGFAIAGNPMTVWLQIMTSTGLGTNGAYDVLTADQGLGIDEDLIDVAEVELLRNDWMPTWEALWWFTDSINAKSFFQSDIYLAFAISPIIKASGEMSIRPFLPPIYGYMVANNMGDTMSDSEIIELPAWSAEYRDVVNIIQYKYAWDGSDFLVSEDWVDQASRTLYGDFKLTIESKGVTAGSTSGMLIAITDRYFRNFALLPQKITIKTKFSERVTEAADQISTTSNRIPNIDTSSLVWEDRIAEVRKVSPDYVNGNMVFELRDHNVGGNKYRVISPSGTDDWNGATEEQKLRYAWIDRDAVII